MGSLLSTEPEGPAPLEAPVVQMDRMKEKKNSDGIQHRYKCNRPLEADFIIEKNILGSGMSGPVRLATSKADGKKCAVKSFKKNGLTKETRQSLADETEMFLLLDHPHIAKLHMVYETNELLHLAMELMRGGEVYDKLAKLKTYDEQMAADTVYQMLLAVTYLHSHDIAHRDLKLENYLYEDMEASHIKLIDFGFAKFWDSTTTMSQACGSLHYVAPEVLQQRYTLQADMWSLGIITFMLLTGRPAFSGTEDQILLKIRTGEPYYPKGFWKLSPVAQNFVQRLLAKNPKSRMTSAEALEHKWIKARLNSDHVCLQHDILDSLRTFTHASHFRRSALCMMAWSLSSEEQAGLREQFLAMDVDKRGTITLNEMKKMLEENFHVESAEAERLFQSIDSDNNHEIEYSEFLTAALEGRLRAHKDVLFKTFQAFDADNSGQISSEELKLALGGSMDKDTFAGVLQEIDTSGDGMIDYEEFITYFTKDAENPELLENAVEKVVSNGREIRRKRSELLVQVIDSLKEDKQPVLTSDPSLGRALRKGDVRDRPEVPARLPILLGAEDGQLSPKKAKP